MVTESTVTSIRPGGGRLVSLDVYRGLVMLAMMIHTLGLKDVSSNPVVGFIYRQLNHADWVGFHFEDFILPSFLFIIGVAIGLSEEKRRAKGEPYRGRFIHALKRSAGLFAIGFLLSWIGSEKIQTGPGVLQILGISYFGGFLFLGKSVRVRFAVCAFLLFIYWFFIFITPVYDVGRNSYIVYKNLVYLIDETLTNSPSRWGYLYTCITSIAVVVYGSIIGKLLIGRKSDWDFMKTLFLLGAAGVVSGLILHPFIPIIKRMFTSSYTLFTCGLATILLGGLFWVVDARGYRAWSFPFIVVGMNSIFIYIIYNLLNNWFLKTVGVFINPLEAYIGAWVSPLRESAGLFCQWLLCLWFYRRNIFFKL